MTVDTSKVREKILMEALKDVPFDGWTQEVLMKASERAGYEPDMAAAVFPQGIVDLVAYFSEWADEKMVTALEKIDPEDLKIRARVAKAAMIRFEMMEPHKESVRAAAKFWARPIRSLRAKQLFWATADKIWVWAGDVSEDYNRYTKRGLLVAVLGSTSLYWLSKNEVNLEQVEAFLRARIEEVLKVGQGLSKFKDLKNLASVLPFKTPFSKKSEEL